MRKARLRAEPYDFRFDDFDIIFLQLSLHVVERVVAVGADDRAAGTCELGGSAELACDPHHAAVLFAHGRTADLVAEVEVAVKQSGQEVIPMRSKRVTDLVGQLGPFADCGVDFRHARLVVEREAAVENFRSLGKVGAVGNEERQVVRNFDRFINTVTELLHVLFVKVHVDRCLVDLRHAVLKSGFDAEFVELDGQHQIRQYRFRDFDLEEADHGAHGSRDDGGGARHPEAVRNVRLVAQREVVVAELNMFICAVSVEGLHAGFEQTDAAVVAELRDAAREVRHVFVGVVIQHGWQDLEGGRFVQRDLGAVVAEYECDCLAIVAVGRIADERCARICFFTNNHGSFLNLLGTGHGYRLFPRHPSSPHSSDSPE